MDGRERETQCDSVDLLTLIARALDQLRAAVDTLESHRPEAGAAHLAATIRQIDRYVDGMDDDPLLRLAPLETTTVRESLRSVRADLNAVVESIASRATRNSAVP
ncbi:MAG: hypothetical protein AB1778_07860 [Candidatus Bipolaricaulota bacterium]